MLYFSTVFNRVHYFFSFTDQIRYQFILIRKHGTQVENAKSRSLDLLNFININISYFDRVLFWLKYTIKQLTLECNRFPQKFYNIHRSWILTLVICWEIKTSCRMLFLWMWKGCTLKESIYSVFKWRKFYES